MNTTLDTRTPISLHHPRNGRRRRDHMAATLMEAAHQLLIEHGPEALTVRRIAGTAGVSTMNVYSRFGGKDGVIDELHMDGCERLLALIDAVPATADVPADLVKIATAYRTFALANPAYYQIMFHHAGGYQPSQEATEIAHDGFARFVARVKVGQDVGQIVSFAVDDALEIAAHLWATCHGHVTAELDGVAAQLICESSYMMGIRTAVAGLGRTSLD